MVIFFVSEFFVVIVCRIEYKEASAPGSRPLRAPSAAAAAADAAANGLLAYVT